MFRTRNYSMTNLFLSLNYLSLLSFSLMVKASSSFALKGLLFWYRRTHATQPCQTDEMIIIRLFLELLNDFYTGYKSIFLFQHIFWGWPFTHSPTDYNKWLLESIQLLVFLGMVIRNRLCLTIFAHRVYGERILYMSFSDQLIRRANYPTHLCSVFLLPLRSDRSQSLSSHNSY